MRFVVASWNIYDPVRTVDIPANSMAVRASREPRVILNRGRTKIRRTISPCLFKVPQTRGHAKSIHHRQVSLNEEGVPLSVPLDQGLQCLLHS